MSTAVIDKGGQTPNVTQSNNSGDPFGQISAGPAAMAQLMIYKIMQLFAEVVKLDQEQKRDSIQAQAKEAQASAEATIAGGQAQMSMYIAMGVLTAASGLLSLGSTVVDRFTTKGQEIGTKVNESYEKMTSMQDMEKTMSPISARNGQDQVIGDQALEDVEVKAEITKRKQEFFKDGEFGSLKKAKENFLKQDGSTVTKADGTTLTNADINAEVIVQQKAEAGHAQWKEEFNLRMKMSSEAHNSAMQEYSTRHSKINLIKDGLTSGLQGTSQGIQAHYTAEKASQDANTSLMNTAAQAAGTVSSDLGQAASKAAEALYGENQILENIHRSNSVNG